MSDFTAKITAILDSRQAESQLNALKSAKHQLDIQVNLKSGNTNVNNFLNSIKTQAQSAGASAGSGFVNSFNSSIGSINTGNATNTIKGLQRALAGFKFDSSQISAITSQLDSMDIAVQRVETRIRQGGRLELKVTGTDALGRTVTQFKEFDRASNTLVSSGKKITQTFNTISTASQKMASSAQITKFDAQITTWLNNNTKANNTYRSSVEELQQRLHSLASSGQVPISTLRELQQQMGAFSAQAKAAGVAGKSFGDTLKGAFSSITKYVSVATLLTKSISTLKDMANNVLEVDTALTELYRVSDLSSAQYDKLYSKMTQSAKNYGTALSDIIDSTASWVRFGFDANTASNLAEITAMYQHVTDLDTGTAVNNLVTAYKGFETQLLEMNNGDSAAAIEMVADIYDKLGNEFAESAADVGDGLSKAASVLSQGGASIQEAAGMFTGINEVLQDSSTSGTALKILTLRIRGMKGELEDLGEDVDENVESISKMQTQILNLTHGKVNIFDDEGNFRNIYDIMKDISAIYDDLTDTERASLLETIAGKNRANAIQALISNWGNVEKATEAAKNSAGTAAQENEIYMDSLQGKLDSLTAVWQAFSNDFMSSSFLKGCVSGLTIIVEALDKVQNSIGTIGMIGAGAGIIAFINNFGKLKELGFVTQAANQITNFVQQAQSMSTAASGFQALGQSLTGFSTSTIMAASNMAGLTAAETAATLAGTGMKVEMIASTLAMTGLSEAELAAALTTAGLCTAEEATTIATTALAGAEGTATGATLGFAASLKAAATGLATFLLTNPVGWAIMAAGAIFGVVKIVDALTESFDEACEKADNARQTLKNAEQDVESVRSSQANLRTEIESLADKYEVEFTDEDSIQDIINKLKELNLATADAQTLSSLETQTQQLEAQLQIKEKIANYDRQEAGKAASNVLEKKTGEWLNEFDEYGNQKYVEENIIERTSRKQTELNKAQAEYNQLLQEHANTEKTTSKWYQAYTEWEKQENRLESLGSTIDSLSGEINDNLEIISENYDSLLDAEGNPLPGLEDTAAQVSSLYGDVLKVDEATEELAESEEEAAAAAETYASSVATIAEKAQTCVSSINAITDALNSQSTGKSISLDTYNSEELKDYTSALEYHNGVMQYNAEKVREITKAKAEEEKATIAANKAQDQAKYLENAKKIQELREAVKSVNDARGKSEIASQIESLLAENAALVESCKQYDIMTASINEATSAYQNWINAQSASQSGDMFDSSLEAFKKINDTLNDSESDSYGRIGNADYKAALEFIIPESVDTKDEAAINSYMESVKQYLTFDEDGNANGLDIAQFCQKAVDAGLMTLDESGESYQIAGQKTMQDFADGLGLSLPLVQAMFGEMEEFGAEFDWADEAGQTFGDLAMKANEAAESLKNVKGFEDLKLVLDVSSFEDKNVAISTLDSNIKSLQDKLANKEELQLDDSQVQDAISIIQYCVAQKQILNQPDVMTVDTSQVTDGVGEVLALLQEFQSTQDTIEMQAAVGADTSEAESKLNSLTTQIQSIDIPAALKIDTTSTESIQTSISNLSAEMIVKCGVDSSLVEAYQTAEHDSTGTVMWDNDTGAVDSYASSEKSAVGIVVWGNNTVNVKTHFTATGTISWSGGHSVNGTAHASGTAKVGGDWGNAPGGKTLVGELGREIVVDPRTGKWYTVGDNGAEFRDIPHGAIVFNHLQSESLLGNGYAIGRATALASGTAMVTGGIKVSQANKSGAYNKPVKSTSSSNNTSKKSYNKSSEEAKKASDDFEEIFDWVEIALNRIIEAINRIEIKAKSVYKTLATRNSALSDEITMLTSQIDLQNQAYSQYMKQAEAVGLSAEWQEKVKNGSIEFSTITDEDLSDKIKDFQKYYEAAIKAKDAVEELHEQIADLYLDKFNNISNDFENQLSLIEHMTQTYEEGLNQLEEAGMLGATAYYKYLIEAENKSIKIMQDELTALEKSLAEAMASGEIEMYSDAWYEMMQNINDVRENIDEATTSILKYAKAMRELEWDYFDFAEDRISQITEETDFLIELLSNRKLFDDNGKMTDAGTATMGLHGENYNVYMAQADDYAKEIEKINAEIANDPTNTDLIKRREELVKLQQDSILNAEKEKQAIVDLISDGYDKQLDSLKKIIDAYTDSLDSAKDLYDYQKKVKQQTAEIASIQKQLAAYANDTSEETKAKVQKLQVDLSDAMEELEETQYERYISDQKKLLNDLYNEYESVLNLRLDNVDALLSECISTINAESGNISDTLSKEAANVGYTISEANKAIWANDGEANSVVALYGENFKGQLTSINASINGIKAYTDTLLAKANAEAAAKKAAEEAAQKKAEEASKPKPSTPTTPQQPQQNKPTFNEDIKRGVAAAIWIYGGKKSGWGNDPERKQRLTAKFGASNAAAIQSYINAHGNNGDLYNYWVSTGKSNLSKYYYNAFKKGTRRVISAQDAWTQEAGQELIVRPSDNALLTSMKPRDEVLTAKMTENIWKMAQNPEEFIGNHGVISISDMIPNGATIPSASNDVTFGDIVISIDHVDDYNDFMNKLKTDRTFEKMIQSMTVDRMVGGSKLAKYKYNWK